MLTKIPQNKVEGDRQIFQKTNINMFYVINREKQYQVSEIMKCVTEINSGMLASLVNIVNDAMSARDKLC